ncbi:MAG: MFS transporter [Gammaproteobacteria bacterium]|nr:MFS transporter [Gammaproteobacteria bacterium]
MNPFSLLASQRLLPLTITQFLGACNDNIFKNALIIFIVFSVAEQKSLNATLFVALASGLFVLPFFLFSITAGQIADKYLKSRLIIKIKLIEIILMSCAALGFYLNHLPLLLTTLFIRCPSNLFWTTQICYFTRIIT